MSRAEDGKTSSEARFGPIIEDSRTWRCMPEKSWEDRPLTESMVMKNINLLPGRTVPGTGDDDRVDEVELFRCLAESTTLTIFMSTRQEPIASDVYRQKIGTVEVEDSRRARGARDIKAFPIKEYSGGGES